MVMTKFAGQISKRLESKVVELREEREWTRKQLAAATGIDQGWVSRIEAGRVEPMPGHIGLAPPGVRADPFSVADGCLTVAVDD
jgi:hypothetical protein